MDVLTDSCVQGVGKKLSSGSIFTASKGSVADNTRNVAFKSAFEKQKEAETLQRESRNAENAEKRLLAEAEKTRRRAEIYAINKLKCALQQQKISWFIEQKNSEKKVID